MITMLECINRVPESLNAIMKKKDQTFEQLLKAVKKKSYHQIILIGSGSSNTAAVTARGFIEKVTGMQTICILPNEFLNNTYALNKEALYVFISQTGTSILTQQAVRKIKDQGCLSVGVTAHGQTKLALAVDIFVEQGCEKEEYPMVTLGYSTCVFTLMMMGLEIAKVLESVSEEEYRQYLTDAQSAAENHRRISDLTNKWFDQNKEQLLKSLTYTVYGSKSLWGVSLEGALKIEEVSKTRVAVGYEIDDGMHGPTMGYMPSNCVLVLNDGGEDSEKCRQLAQWAKTEKQNGFIAGYDVLDETDLSFETKGKDYSCLEFSSVVQVLAYRLAESAGIDLTSLSMHKESHYFITHDKGTYKDF